MVSVNSITAPRENFRPRAAFGEASAACRTSSGKMSSLLSSRIRTSSVAASRMKELVRPRASTTRQ